MHLSFFSQQSVFAWAVCREIQRLSQPCLGVRAGAWAGAPASAQLAMPALQTGLRPSAEHPKPSAVALCGPSPAVNPCCSTECCGGSLQHSHSNVPLWEAEGWSLRSLQHSVFPDHPSGRAQKHSSPCLEMPGDHQGSMPDIFQGCSQSLTIPQVVLTLWAWGCWGDFTWVKLLTAHPHLLRGPDCPAKA